MKISYTWLKDFLEIDLPAAEVAESLTNLGLEVEGTESFSSVKGGLQGVVVGKVLSCEKHPNADRLKLTSVDVGAEKPLQIICGAPNVAKDQQVAVATLGTVLYDEHGEEWQIKKSKIRGVESQGMICSEKELGIGESQEGIMVLEGKLKNGQPLTDYFEVLNDDVFEIDLTPNRSDAMSHYGVARDLRAGLLEQGINKSLIEPSINKFKIDNHVRNIPIEVMNSTKTPRYCGITLSEITVGESPAWLKNRLAAIGVSSINNIVDATNYVMHELGQPFHAFDADQIQGGKISVREAKEGEKMITLDGVERTLDPEDLLICDTEKALCIAGVYGGIDSGVTERTKNIFLESAYFDSVSIRKTAKRHGLNTDASFRFERGIDPNLTDFALKRLVILIKELAGGVVSSELNDVYPKKIEDFQVFLRYRKINKLIGYKIEQSKLKSILTSLDIQVKNSTETGMGLSIPPYRTDVTREVDVIEEILRIYGYNHIDVGQKLNSSLVQTTKYNDNYIQQLVANQLMGQGFYEIMSNSLTFPEHLHTSETENVEILNPLSKELSVLRQSLLPGGLASLAFNSNRKLSDLRFFEFGKSYHLVQGKYVEQKRLGLFVTGRRQREAWNSDGETTDFFYLKGVLNSIFDRLGCKVDYVSSEETIYSDGMNIMSAKKNLGHFGILKTAIGKTYDIPQEIGFANIDWDRVLEVVADKSRISVKSIPKYPAVRRDFALLLDQSVKFRQIEELAYKAGSKLLKEVNLFDVYQGKNLPENKKSYAVSFTFLDKKSTLTDKKVDKLMDKLRKEFETHLGAELR